MKVFGYWRCKLCLHWTQYLGIFCQHCGADREKNEDKETA